MPDDFSVVYIVVSLVVAVLIFSPPSPYSGFYTSMTGGGRLLVSGCSELHQSYPISQHVTSKVCSVPLEVRGWYQQLRSYVSTSS